jgi:hypothetical protein
VAKDADGGGVSGVHMGVGDTGTMGGGARDATMGGGGVRGADERVCVWGGGGARDAAKGGQLAMETWGLAKGCREDGMRGLQDCTDMAEGLKWCQ